jgi:carbon-monoxide dehydrogenase medium subunit
VQDFRLHRPTQINRALELQHELGSESVWYAGGTELLMAMDMGVLRPNHLIDIKRLDNLERIRVAGGFVEIGPGVTHQELAEDPDVGQALPVLAQMERRIGNWRVRSSGTLAGNLAFAEPRSDPATLLLACDAEIVLTSISGARTVKMREFIQGPYWTVRNPDELITSIRIPEVEVGSYLKFQTVERPTVGVAIVGNRLDGRFVGEPAVSIGAASPQPTLCQSAAALLKNQEIDAENPRVKEAGRAAAAELELLDDITGSAKFKARLIQALVPRAVALISVLPLRGRSE